MDRKEERLKRRRRVRKKVFGTEQRPRLCVAKSLRHIYAQLVDDEHGHTLVSASTLDQELGDVVSSCGVSAATKVGEILAQRALEKGITTVVFDRGGYRYHGVVAALAKASREGGLEF
jgi:large subunit ribosomal protein L18